MQVGGPRAFGEWKDEIEQLLAEGVSRPPSELIEELCNLAEAMGSDAAEEILAAHPDLFQHAEWLKRANFQRIVDQDHTETRRILSDAVHDGLRFPEAATAKRLLSYNRSRQMFETIDFRDCDCLVMVGCGSLPFTMFHVHDRTDVPEIVGIDILPDAIATARELSEKLGYSRVRFELRNGCDYDFGKAQIVYLASTVFPKRVVMSRVAETAAPGARIISRDPYSLGRLWVEDSEGHGDARLEAIGSGQGIWSLTRDVYFRRLPLSSAATAPG